MHSLKIYIYIYIYVWISEVSRYYPWKIVDVGALRHLVVLMRFGDVPLKTIGSTTLAMCSQDMDIG